MRSIDGRAAPLIVIIIGATSGSGQDTFLPLVYFDGAASANREQVLLSWPDILVGGASLYVQPVATIRRLQQAPAGAVVGPVMSSSKLFTNINRAGLLKQKMLS